MKKMTILVLEKCPWCIQALKRVDELKSTRAEYHNLEITIIDEEKQPELARQYKYWYVPTFFLDDQKIYEGVKELAKVDDVFAKAVEPDHAF